MSHVQARLSRIVLVAVLALAAVLRLADFAARRPLWLDEAMLALNLGSRSFPGLAGALDFDQSAPPLFLWLVKAVTLAAGMGEPALRAVPLLAGLALPWLLWRATRGLLDGDAALIAAALAAISLPLLRYTGELKPYSTDALASVVLIALTLRVRAAPQHAVRWWQLGAAGAVALLLSFPAVFVLAGGFAALLLDPAIRSAPGPRRKLIWLGLCWVAGFGATFVLVYQPQTSNEYLRHYWSGTVLDPAEPGFSSRVRAAIRRLTTGLPALDPIDVKGRLLLLALGIAAVARRGGLGAAGLVGAPFLALAAGALVGKFPVSERLFLFLAPFTFIAVAALLAEILRLVRLRPGWAGAAGGVIVLAWGGSGVIDHRRHPPVQQDGRETARALVLRRGTDPVYVLPGSLPAWIYYTTDWRDPDRARLEHLAFVSRAAGPAAMNSLVREERTDPVRDALRYRSASSYDLIAARPGTVYREPGGYRQREPEPGWAAGEVDRILEEAKPHAWIYAQDHVPTLLPALREELRRRGAETVDSLGERKTVALRIRQADPARP